MNIIIESIEPFIKDNVEQQTTSNLSIQNPSSKLSTLNCDLQNSPITSTINHFSPTITLSHNDSKALNYSNLMNVVQSQSFIPIKSFYNSMEQMYESKQQHQSPSSQHSHSHHQQDHQKLSQIIDFVPLVNSKHYDANLLDFNQTNNYNHNPFGNDTIPTGLNLPSSLQQTPVNYTTGISLTGRWMFSHNRSVIQCFICRQSIMNTGGNDDGIGSGNSEIENLVKHLTIAHMLPLPIVMNYVITYMTEKLTEYNPLDIRINKVNNDNNSTIESITASHTTVTTNDTTVTTKNSQNAQKFVNTLNIDPSWNTVHSSENTLPFNIPNVLYKDCRLNQCEAENLENFSLKVPLPPPQSQPPPLTAIKQPTSSIGYDLHDHVNNNYWICPHCNIQFDNFQQFHLHFTQNHNSLLSDMNLFNFIEGNSFSNNNNNNNSSTTNSLLSSQMLLSAIQPKSINTAIISRSMVTGNNNNSTEDISLMPVINEVLNDCNDWLRNYNQTHKNTNEFNLLTNTSMVQTNFAALAAATVAAYGNLPGSKKHEQLHKTSSINEFDSNHFSISTSTIEMMNTISSPSEILNSTSTITKSTPCNLSTTDSINSSICSSSIGMIVRNNRNQMNMTEQKRKFNESLYARKPCLSEVKRTKFEENENSNIEGMGLTSQKQDQNNNDFWKLLNLFPHFPMLWPPSSASGFGPASSSSSSLLKSSYNELNNNELLQKYAKHTIQSLEKNQTLFNNNIATHTTNNSNNKTHFTKRITEINDINCSSTRNNLKLNIENFNNHYNNGTITSSPHVELTISNNNDNNTSINLSTSITNTSNITTVNKNDNHWSVNSTPVCSTFHHTPHSCSFEYNNNNKLNIEQENIDKLTTLESKNLIHNSHDHINSPVQQNANNTISCNINNSTCSNVSNELYDQNLPCSTPEQQQTHSTTNTTTTITSTGSTIHINGAVHNTLRKTRSDMKVIHRYLIQIKHDTREIHQIPCHELDSYIQDFVLTAKKKDGHEYEPESLKAFVHSLERHLKHHGYSHSVLKGNAFAGTRSVLNQRLNELRALSRSGTSTNGAYAYPSNGANNQNNSNKRISGVCNDSTSENRPINYTRKHNSNPNGLSSAELLKARILGTDNPQAILNSLWLMNRTQFNIGGTQRHRNLVWGQFQLITDDNGIKAIKFTPLFESAEVRYCRGYGGTRGGAANHDPLAKTQPLSCTGSAKRQPLPFNCVELFEIYANLRPLEARGVSEPFYLCPDVNWEQQNENGVCNSWFKSNAAGSQLLSRIPRSLGLKPSKEPISTSGINPSNMHKLQTSNSLITNQIKDSDRLITDHCNQILSNLSNYRDICQMQSQNHTITNDNNSNNVNYNNNYYFNNLSRSISNPSLIPQNLFNFFPFLFPPTPSSTAIITTTATTLAPSVNEQSLTSHSLLNASFQLPSIMQNLNSSKFQQTFKENFSNIGEEYNNNNNRDNFQFSHEQFEQEQCGHDSTPNKISATTAGDEDNDDSRGEGEQIDVNEEGELDVDDEERQNIEIINSNCFSPKSETEQEIENLSTLDNNSSKLLTKLSSEIRNDLLHTPDGSEQYESVVNSSHHSKSLSSSSCLSSSSPSSASSRSPSSEIGTFSQKIHHHRHHRRHPHSDHQRHRQRLEIKSTHTSYQHNQQEDNFDCRPTDDYNKEHWSSPSSSESSSSSPSPRLTTPLSTIVTNTNMSVASTLSSTTPSSTPLIKSTTSMLARFNKIT